MCKNIKKPFSQDIFRQTNRRYQQMQLYCPVEIRNPAFRALAIPTFWDKCTTFILSSFLAYALRILSDESVEASLTHIISILWKCLRL